MGEITIRKAVKTDCDRMLQLVKDLAEFERAPNEVTVTQEHFTSSGFGPSPVWWAYVAEVEGSIQAFALYYIRFSTWKGQRMYLEDLFVTPEYRGFGIGSQLLNTLIAEAKEKGLSGIVWQVLDWNQPAIDFYKKIGAQLDPEWINCSIAF